MGFATGMLNVAAQQSPQAIVVYCTLMLVALATTYQLYYFFKEDQPLPGFPIVALKEEGLGPKRSWFREGRRTIMKGLKEHDGRPFQVLTGVGPKIVLPPHFAEEVKNHPDANFGHAFGKDMFSSYPGIQNVKYQEQDESLLAEVVNGRLTPSLGLVTNDIVDELKETLSDTFGDEKEWREFTLKPKLTYVVARVSSRVFLGLPLCRDQEWLDITQSYTLNALITARVLRQIPAFLRPTLRWWFPPTRKIQRDIANVIKLIEPEVEMCKERATKAREAGQKPPKTSDMLGWMYEIEQNTRRPIPVNYPFAQLNLTMAAIFSTSEAVSHAILDMCQHPEILQPLREEVIREVGQNGWNKTTLYNLRLMDSFLKESQRLWPPMYLSMHRLATKDIPLSDGTIIPANTCFMVAGSYRDPAVFSNPDTFDVSRFLRARDQPGHKAEHQFVTATVQHMAWGYGQHACPGRFFVNCEMKMLLAQFVLKYDCKLLERSKRQGEAALRYDFESFAITSPKAKVCIRRRREEIDLDAI